MSPLIIFIIAIVLFIIGIMAKVKYTPSKWKKSSATVTHTEIKKIAHRARQRDLAAANRLSTIYTPQVVRNGQDWHADAPSKLDPKQPARASIVLLRLEGTDNFQAQVSPTQDNVRWSAYWTVTEHGHNSKVKAGENAGVFLQHDFVVRQYVPVGNYLGNQTLKFVAIPSQAGHPRQINLVVSDPQTGAPLQAVSLQCS